MRPGGVRSVIYEDRCTLASGTPCLLFAEAKGWHGLRRFRLRGLEQVNREALLTAAGQNLKRLLSRGGWGRRPWPSGAAGLRLDPRATTALP